VSAPIILPLSFEPISAPFTTASYTIPANQYALCEPLVGWCTINGVPTFLVSTYSLYSVNTSGTLYFPIVVSAGSWRVQFSTGGGSNSKRLLFSNTGGSELRVIATSPNSGANIDVGFNDATPVTVFSGTPSGTSGTGLTALTNLSSTLFAERQSPGGTFSASINVLTYKPRPVYLSAGTSIAGGLWIVSLYRKIT